MNISTVRRDYWPTQEWQAAEPESVGMHPDKLLEVDKALTSQYGSINGIVIIRQGFLKVRYKG